MRNFVIPDILKISAVFFRITNAYTLRCRIANSAGRKFPSCGGVAEGRGGFLPGAGRGLFQEVFQGAVRLLQAVDDAFGVHAGAFQRRVRVILPEERRGFRLSEPFELVGRNLIKVDEISARGRRRFLRPAAVGISVTLNPAVRPAVARRVAQDDRRCPLFFYV